MFGSSIFRKLTRCCLFLLAASAGARAQSLGACEPWPEVKRALEQIRIVDDNRILYKQRQDQEIAEIRALLAKYPGDLFVLSRYQDASRNIPSRTPALFAAQYKSMLDQHPNDPMYLYLYGRGLIGLRTTEARSLMAKALQRAPGFPWPHLSLADIYQSEVTRDRKKASQELATFIDRCPSQLEVLNHLEGIDDTVLMQSIVLRMRQVLEDTISEVKYSYYGALRRALAP